MQLNATALSNNARTAQSRLLAGFRPSLCRPCVNTSAEPASGHSQSRRIACNVFTAPAPASVSIHEGRRSEAPGQQHGSSAAAVVVRFIDALNARDLSALLQLVADDVQHVDLSHEAEGHCKEDVARFYSDVVSSMPEKVKVVVDDITGGDDTKAGVMWHMEVDGMEVPCSRGLSFYRVSPPGSRRPGLITYVRQSPEHWVKLSGVLLSASASATPLIDSLGPMALPNFWSNLARGASNMLASAPPVEEVLMSLAAAGAANTVPAMVGSTFSTFMPASHERTGYGQSSFRSTATAAAATGPTRPSAAASAAASAVKVAASAATAATSGPSAAPSRSSPVVCAATVILDAPTTTTSSSPASSASSSRGTGLGSGRTSAAAATVAAAAGPAPVVMVELRAPPSLSPAAAAAAAAAAAGATVVVADGGEGQAAAPVDPVACLAGIWEKDLELSDVGGYEKALDLWQISGVQKATARLIEGLELATSGASARGGRGSGPASFNVHFLTIIPYFKVTEVYPMGGGRSKMRRRDQRGGDAMAHAESVPQGVVCRATWAAPFAGSLEESYTLPEGAASNTLHVRSTIRVGDKEATTLQVYHRRNMSAAQLISASEKRNGKATDVLKRFSL